MNRETRKLLKGVSRSFYLSLVLLPKHLRNTLGLSFLCCKIADTITDTELVPVKERLEMLHQYRLLFLKRAGTPHVRHLAPSGGSPHGGSDAEAELLQSTEQIVAQVQKLSADDQRAIRWLVPELIQGMSFDLTYFNSSSTNVKSLPDDTTLDRYTYFVAGCVGRFWTRILRNHYAFARNWGEEMERVGEELGKGLQLVNILRDLPRDLQQGRCYLPVRNVNPSHLPLYAARAREKLRTGNEYVNALPRSALRLRASVLLPMRLGLETLDLLEHSDRWLDPSHVIKVPRWKVYKTLIFSFLS